MNHELEETLRARVLALLSANGYSELAPSQSVADVVVETGGLWEGPKESLDLSLVADRPSTREDGLRLYWSVQRIARALDAARSRRTLTVILVGERTTDAKIPDLVEIARVLVVDGSLPLERMLAPLLPLRLPTTATTEIDGLDEVMAQLSGGSEEHELKRLVRAAEDGALAVRTAYLAWVSASFDSERSTK